MQFSQKSYDTLNTFITKADNNSENEFEVRFWGKKNKFITEESYKRVFNKLSFLKENNGYGLISDKSQVLDVFINDNIENMRMSIMDEDNIKKYWLLNHTKDIHVEFMDKEKLEKYDDMHYNIRFSLSQEKIKESEKGELYSKNMELFDSDTIKTFRLKNRYSFQTDDGLYRIDMTSVKMGVGKSLRKSHLFSSPISYEIEIEYIGNKGREDGVSAADQNPLKVDILLEWIHIILIELQNNELIMDEYIIEEVYANYKKIVNEKTLSFIAANPVSIHRIHLVPNKEVKNIYQHYAVTLKADGERYLLIVIDSKNKSYRGKILLMNNNYEILDTGFKDEEWIGTLLEGELIQTEDGRELYIYDGLFNKGVDIRKRRLVQIGKREEDDELSRLKTVEMFLKSPTRKSILENRNIQLKSKRYMFSMRNDGSDIFQKAKEMWGLRKSQNFENDGMIFTPIQEYYPMYGGTWNSLFKWKPPHLNTIDFLIRTKKDVNGSDIKSPYIENIVRADGKNEILIKQYKTVELYVTGFEIIFNKRDKTTIKKKIPTIFNPYHYNEESLILLENLSQANIFINEGEKMIATDPIYNTSVEIRDNIIVEFQYDSTKEERFRWNPIRFRRDKTSQYQKGEPQYGNSEKTANDIFKTILNPITEDMITTGNVPLENIEKNQQDLDSGKVYFSRLEEETNISTKERFPYQNFHNYHVKSSLFKNSSPSYIENKTEIMGKILDLCSGKGVDIIKIKNARYRECVGMDIDIENIKYAKNFYQSIVPTPKPKASYVRGDAGRLIFPNQSCCYTETDKIQLRKYIPVKYHFDTVCSLFCIHYFFKNEITLRTFIQNISDNLKIGGSFIGTCFDGIRIYDALKNDKSISGKTYSQETLWKIDKKYTKKIIFTKNKCHYGTEIDVFVKTIGNVHTEYLVNFLFFDKIMEEYGFELVMRQSFEEYYDTLMESMEPDDRRMKENALKMSSEEKRFSFLNSGFMYRKVRNSSDSLLKKLVELMEKEIKIREKKVSKVSVDTEHDIEELEIEEEN